MKTIFNDFKGIIIEKIKDYLLDKLKLSIQILNRSNTPQMIII